MKEPFEIGWVGGAAERHFRKIRPQVRDIPWGTLDPKRYPSKLVERARLMWTQMAFAEYATAAAFAQVVTAMLAAKAPLDLTGMAADFITDETCHAELASRMVIELGGAMPMNVDYGNLARAVSPSLTPFQQANERVLRLSCIAEQFSAHLAVGVLRVAAHPLTRAVYEVIARDETRHGRFGGLYMQWACTEMDDAERARLARVALEALQDFTVYWRRPVIPTRAGMTRDGYTIPQVNALGWMEASAYVARARRAVRVAIVAPLERVGIELDATSIDELLDVNA